MSILWRQWLCLYLAVFVLCFVHKTAPRYQSFPDVQQSRGLSQSSIAYSCCLVSSNMLVGVASLPCEKEEPIGPGHRIISKWNKCHLSIARRCPENDNKYVSV
jgi:hypothetical protein